MSLPLSPVGTDDDLRVWLAMSRASSLAEACHLLVGAIEQVSGHAAAIIHVDPAGHPRAWMASGRLGAGDATTPPDLADWVVLPIDEMAELRLLLRAPVEGDDEVTTAGMVQGHTLCQRSVPLLTALSRSLDAEFRQQAMDAVWALGDRLSSGQTVRPANLVDALASLGLVDVWLWGLGATSAEWVLLAASGAEGAGLLAPPAPDWERPPQGPVMAMATDLTWVPIVDGGRVLAYLAVRCAPAWLEAQCRTAVECLQRLSRMPWLPTIILSALTRLQGPNETRSGKSPEDGGMADLQAITRQAAKMTHDVRNKLNVAATGTYLLRMKVDSADGDLARLLQQIEDNIHASSEAMGHLLEIYRRPH